MLLPWAAARWAPLQLRVARAVPRNARGGRLACFAHIDKGSVDLGTPLVGPLGRSPLGFCRGLRQGCPLAAQGKSADHSLAQGISARTTRHGTHWSLVFDSWAILVFKGLLARAYFFHLRASAIRLMGVAEGATTTRLGTHGSSCTVTWVCTPLGHLPFFGVGVFPLHKGILPFF